MKDTMIVDILPDGTIKTTTSPISGPIHSSAESFLADVATLTGGPVTRQRRGHSHAHHVHTHTEEQ